MKLGLPKQVYDQVKNGDEDWNKTHNVRFRSSRKADRKAARAAKRGKSTKRADPQPTLGKKSKMPVNTVEVDGEQQQINDNMGEKETWAALKALKKRPVSGAAPAPKRAKKEKKIDYENFKSAAELEQMARDEQDAVYYAKMLGQKSLKLRKTENDGLEDIMGDLDFDHFTDKSNSEDESEPESEQEPEVPESDSDSEPFIENPWGKDDSLSEGDFDSDSEDEEEAPADNLGEDATWAALKALKQSKPKALKAPTKAKSSKEMAKSTKEADKTPVQPSDAESDSEPFIENPWTDDSLSEGDFDSESESEKEVLEDNLGENETWAALKALKKGDPSGNITPASYGEDEKDDENAEDDENDSEPFIENPWTDDSLSEGDFDSEEEVEDEEVPVDNLGEDETWAALRALKSGNAEPEPETPKAKPAKIKSAKENPFLPGGKYVPPSKRKLLETTTQDDSTLKLQRQLKGMINKLTESNVGAIINELEVLFAEYPKHLVGGLVTRLVMESIVSQGMTLQESNLVVSSTVVTALYKTIGVSFGAQYIQDIVQEFLNHYAPDTRDKEVNNLLMLIMGAYTLHMVGSRLVYDLVALLMEQITENNIELLLLVIRTCGSQLRADDPAALKVIVSDIQAKMSKLDPSQMTVRNKILVESILNLKNNRQKPANEMYARMRKFLGGIKGEASEPLQVSVDDVRNIETNGKWWLVGAAYRSTSTASGGAIAPANTEADAEAMDDLISAEPNWLALARKQRLNTDVRRAIFIAIMGADDYVEACIRIDKLRLGSKQEREVVYVLLHCLCNETAYNPYYALVAGKQCTRHTMRKSFQFQLWDYLNAVQDSMSSDVRKAMYYARFYASLVAQGCLTLDLLKSIDFLAEDATLRVFEDVFLVFLFKAVGKQCESSKDFLGNDTFDARPLARLVAGTKDRAVLQGIKYLLPRLTASEAAGECRKRDLARVRWCIETCAQLVA